MTQRFQAACCDGEDYELLMAVESVSWPAAAAWPFQVPLSVVGWLVLMPALEEGLAASSRSTGRAEHRASGRGEALMRA